MTVGYDDIEFSDLKSHVAYDPEDIGIAVIGIKKTAAVIADACISSKRFAHNAHFLKRYIAVCEDPYLRLIKDQRISHVLIERMGDLREIAGIGFKTVIKSRA